MYRKTVPGEWETDEQGRRFRMFGNVKEYEMTVRINGIDVPQSEVDDFHRRAKEAEAEREAKTEPPKTAKLCPFMLGRNALEAHCKRDCAFFCGNSCSLAVTLTKPSHDTQGLDCPISARSCNPVCALYAGGCKFIELLKGL